MKNISYSLSALVLLLPSIATAQASQLVRRVVIDGRAHVVTPSGHLAISPKGNVAINQSCTVTEDCRAGLTCTADWNPELLALQAALPAANRVGRCIDTTGKQDSAPGLQADFDRIPYLAVTNESQGVEYRMPPGATILIGSGAGMPGGPQSATGCRTYSADDGATAGVTENIRTIRCPTKPFVGYDFELALAIDLDSNGSVDFTANVGGLEGSVVAYEGEFAFLDADIPGPTTTNASVTWTRRKIGLRPLRRMSFEGNGAIFKCGDGTLGTTNIEVCFSPEWNRVNNPDESVAWGIDRSTFKNFTIAPVSNAANTNWGFVPNIFGAVVKNVWAHHFGRCFQQSSPGELWNANTQWWEHISASNCYGSGFYSHGADNNGSMYMQVRTAGGTGITDNAYIGSLWVGPMSESNTAISNDPKPDLQGQVSYRFDMGSNGMIINPYLELGDPLPDIGSTARNAMVFAGSHWANRMPRGLSTNIGGAVSEMVFAHSATDVRLRLPGTNGTGSVMEFEDRGSSYGGADGTAYYLRKEAGTWAFDRSGVGSMWELSTVPGQAKFNGKPVGPVWASVSVNHASIAAGTVLEATATIADLQPGDAVLCAPTTAIADGSFIAYSRVSAAGTVSIGRANPTGSAFDPASTTYTCRGGTFQSLLDAHATIDPPSLNAAETAEVTMAMVGARVGSVAWCSPDVAVTAGVAYVGARVSAEDTLSLRFANISAGVVDAAAVRMHCRGGPAQGAVTASNSLDYGSLATNAQQDLTVGLSGIATTGMTVCSPAAAPPATILFPQSRGNSGTAVQTAYNIGATVDPASLTMSCAGWVL